MFEAKTVTDDELCFSAGGISSTLPTQTVPAASLYNDDEDADAHAQSFDNTVMKGMSEAHSSHLDIILVRKSATTRCSPVRINFRPMILC